MLLYSTKTAAVVEMSQKTLARVRGNDISADDIRTLRKSGLLVSDPEVERREILGYVDELNSLNRSLNIKLVMNLDCNLECKYCFEGSRKGKHYMTKRTASDFIAYVTKKIKTKGDFKELVLTFYGGEPLLSMELIESISRRLKLVAAEHGIRFSTYLVTNGTLLTKKIVKLLKLLGLKEAQVTVDGPRNIHNSFRPFKSGAKSFDKIMNNVKDVRGLINICLTGNFTRYNYEKFPRLLSWLKRNTLGPGRIKSVQFSPVASERSDFGPPDFHDGWSSLDEPWLFEAFLYTREEILKKGFRFAKVAPGLCMMEYENNILVNYNGDIYKCPGLLGREEFRIGDLTSGIKDYRVSHNLDNWKNAECLDCSYLPLCFGGCRYMKYVRDGNMDGVDCRKPYYDATLETMVKQDIRYGLRA